MLCSGWCWRAYSAPYRDGIPPLFLHQGIFILKMLPEPSGARLIFILKMLPEPSGARLISALPIRKALCVDGRERCDVLLSGVAAIRLQRLVPASGVKAAGQNMGFWLADIFKCKTL